MKVKLNLANVLTASRMVYAILIWFTPTFSVPFFILYLVGSVTDMIDGTIARILNQESAFGAKLDTIADFAFVTTVIIKVISSVYVPVWLWVWMTLILLIKMITFISGYVLHHRFLSEHTLMNKVAGILLFVLPITIGIGCFPWQALAAECILTCSVTTLAAAQESYYVHIGKEIL